MIIPMPMYGPSGPMSVGEAFWFGVLIAPVAIAFLVFGGSVVVGSIRDRFRGGYCDWVDVVWGFLIAWFGGFGVVGAVGLIVGKWR